MRTSFERKLSFTRHLPGSAVTATTGQARQKGNSKGSIGRSYPTLLLLLHDGVIKETPEEAGSSSLKRGIKH